VPERSEGLNETHCDDHEMLCPCFLKQTHLLSRIECARGEVRDETLTASIHPVLIHRYAVEAAIVYCVWKKRDRPRTEFRCLLVIVSKMPQIHAKAWSSGG
jgi:hypothetical protein